MGANRRSFAEGARAALPEWERPRPGRCNAPCSEGKRCRRKPPKSCAMHRAWRRENGQEE